MKLYNCKVCYNTNPNDFHTKIKSLCKIHYSISQYNSSKKWAKDNLWQFRLIGARLRAKKKGIEFNITKEDIEKLIISQNNRCYYSNILFDINSLNYTPSIDRIDSNRGYTIDNIRVVVNCVNYMKNDMKEEDFLFVIKQIYQNYQK